MAGKRGGGIKWTKKGKRKWEDELPLPIEIDREGVLRRTKEVRLGTNFATGFGLPRRCRRP